VGSAALPALIRGAFDVLRWWSTRVAFIADPQGRRRDMGIRKNAKFLTTVEQEAFVRACVLMKADIVNPAAPAADRYSRWDELVALHRMIQNANAPGVASPVNFGHGGTGAFSFLSWHRYFLYRIELALQSYVPGVMIPYWDWTDPAPLMTGTFLGPDGAAGTQIVTTGYFAATAPGTPTNPMAVPSWWPASLTGWQLPAAFGGLAGSLTRALDPVASLPSVTDLQETLAKAAYPAFQAAIEAGTGLTSGHQMHNALHGWVGGHMGSLTGSPFDPLFYLHHCNIDRLWAMWQLDGHATEYPTSGGKPQHHRTDVMYPWTGGAAGYSSNLTFGTIAMPDFSALGAQHNVDTLDHRALGYSYDTMAVIGIGLDRTGSMLGMTPDPMTVSAPDVTKWEAARRGVSAFLHDCEVVYASGATYVVTGIETFRSLPANDFTAVFPGTPYGLVKSGGAYSRAVFDSVAAGMSPAGGTPLADALADVEARLVAPPFGWVPADEPRFLAMLTDGLLTSGAPLSSIADGAFANTAIFAMGFGTGADVDYGTLAAMVAKGRTLTTPQVFHGENAGTIDKFYSNALARAIGFTTIFDPVLELFEGEHVHLDLEVTSAEEALFLTVQGMDFDDASWRYHLIAPDGVADYGDGDGHTHRTAHASRRPHVTARRADGRLAVMLQRDSADASAWVGTWRLMIAYRAREIDAMVMPDLGELMFPVAAGPVRGSRFARLLHKPAARIPARSVVAQARHPLDVAPGATNRSANRACSVVVNVYARTRLRLELSARLGDQLSFELRPELLAGSIHDVRGFARLVAPAHDLAASIERLKPSQIPRRALLRGSLSRPFDAALVLAALEQKSPQLAALRDEQLAVVSHDGGPMHAHVARVELPGAYHVGWYVEGAYCPEHGSATNAPHHHGMAPPTRRSKKSALPVPIDDCGPDCRWERFARILGTSIAVPRGGAKKPARQRKRR